MLTNEDINMIKALIYASKRFNTLPGEPQAFSNRMDEYIKYYLEHVQPSRLTD